MRRLFLSLLLLAGLAAPAYAEEAAPDEPQFSAAILPLPLVAIYGIVGYENFHIGPTRHDVHAKGGYVWSTNIVYDPSKTDYTELAAEHETNFWHLIADWDWRMSRDWTLLLDGYVAGGGVQNAPGYDQALTNGVSATWGPALRYSTLDDLLFPTRGFYAMGEWAPGVHWGAEQLTFHRASLDVARFVPFGPNATLMMRASGKAAWPKLAWIDKYYAGGAFNVRGYQWNRFTGDRLLSGALEYRNLFAPDLLGLVGVDFATKVGLAWEAYLDAGRVWESTVGVPFLADFRYGGGTGLMLTIDRAPLGRLEVSVGNEGPYFAAGFGASF